MIRSCVTSEGEHVVSLVMLHVELSCVVLCSVMLSYILSCYFMLCHVSSTDSSNVSSISPD